jgi:hypothetical protein
VEVLNGLENLAPRSTAEQAQALRRNWPDNLRIACDARAFSPGDRRVRQLITPPGEPGVSVASRSQRIWARPFAGVLFADMHNVTRSPKAAGPSM